MLISIIVPVYNVKNYLKKCLDSLVNQTYKNLEIIVVNDGSDDGSEEICNEYARKYDFIQVIEKENGGLSDARNCGIRAATGEYIGFVDSDDWIENDMYQSLIEVIIKYNADIAMCGRYIVQGNSVLSLYTSEKIRVYKGNEALKQLLLGKELDSSVCDKLFHKSLIKDIEFPIGKIHEDIFTTHKIVNKCKKMVHIGSPKYYYYNRKGSITKSQFSKRNFDLIEAYQQIREEYENLQFNDIIEFNYNKNIIHLLNKIIYSHQEEEFRLEILSFKNYFRKNINIIFFNKYIDSKMKIKILLIVFFYRFYRKVILLNFNK